MSRPAGQVFEFFLHADPVSVQTRRRERLHRWKAEVRSAAEKGLSVSGSGFIADRGPVAATILYFTAAALGGDIDNIVKPILDALISIAYVDDRQVERVLVQKVEPQIPCTFISPSAMLTAVITAIKPVVYVRVDTNLTWRSIA